MKTYTYKKSLSLFKRAAEVIPCGIYGHFSPAPLIPASDYPYYSARAKGARFWDVDGNEFIDYMCAYGPMVLGYNNPKVDAAAMKQLKNGNCITAVSPVMIELAETLVDTVDIADWAFFAKNGGDVTSYALMVARAATGRNKIIMFKGGYHGVAPWAQGPGHPGTVAEDQGNLLYATWNDYEGLEKIVSEHPGQIAGMISTPYHHPAFSDNELPAPGFWEKVQKLMNKNGIVLIIDDVRCGFRLDMRGSNAYFGFKPDLVCFCKAIANGYPISALVGTEAMKTFAAKVFYTGSYWGSAVPMAAGVACLKELKKANAPAYMLKIGQKLLDGLVDCAQSHGFTLKTSGVPSMPFLRIVDDESLMLHQDWCGECTKRGAYFTSHHNWFVSVAHTDADIKKTLNIADDAFKAVSKKYGR
jgi:glutamate-1-semialdehyde 2,1-aminomutase